MAEATNPADAQVQALSAMMGPMMVMMVVSLVPPPRYLRLKNGGPKSKGSVLISTH